MSLSISLLGSRGRMGQTLKKLIQTQYTDRTSLALEFDQESDFSKIDDINAMIDFSLPSGTKRAIEALDKSEGKIFVSGTTGITDETFEKLKSLGKKHRIAWSSNFSTGVYAFRQILKQSAPLLKKLNYKLRFEEIHHIHKKDQPSGTAKTLIEDMQPFFEDPLTCESQREGEWVGYHKGFFDSQMDTIEIAHNAHDRSIFAKGAIDLALWLNQKPNGFYQMEDYFKDLQA